MPLPLLVALAGAPAPSPAVPPRPLVVGHRGARARFPENSLLAVRHALAAGAGGVEVDVRLTADDVPVVSHDATLPPDRCRTPDGALVPAGLALRSLSWATLRRFDCGERNPRFPRQQSVPGTPIPSLPEVLDLLDAPEPPGARRATLFLELKGEGGAETLSPDSRRLANVVVDLLRARSLLGRTLVLSFDRPLLRSVRALEPSLPLVPLVDGREDLVALARSEGAAWVGVRHTLLARASVEALHAAGVKVYAWTANAAREQDRLEAIGVDAIGTDDPATLLGRRARGAPR